MGVVKATYIASNTGVGLSGGCRLGLAEDGLLPAMAALPAEQNAAQVSGLAGAATTGKKGKNKKKSGQHFGVAIQQQSVAVENRREAVEEGSSRPAEDMDTSEVGWTRVGKKGSQKMKSGQPGGAAVQQLSDGKGFEEGSSRKVRKLHSSVGGAPIPGQVGSVVQDFKEVGRKSFARSWAEECAKSLYPHSRSAAVSRGKARGNALLPPK